MSEVGHLVTLIFIIFIWLILVFVTIANMYYFNRIYIDGGNQYLSSGSAWSITICCFVLLILEIISAFFAIYLVYVEYLRSNEKERLELQLERYRATINAINVTYEKNVQSIKEQVKEQVDEQVKNVTNAINEKNQEIAANSQILNELVSNQNFSQNKENIL